MSENEQAPNGAREDTSAMPPEMDELREMAARHGKRALIIGVAALVVVGIGAYFYIAKRNASERAADLLDKARGPKDLEAIVRDYPKASVAPAATLKLARLLYDQGDFSRSETAYNDFLTRYPDHSMRSVAELGRIHCLEGKGLFEDALKGFEAFATKNGDGFLAPQAIIGKARCQQLLGKTADARITLEDFLAEHPQSKWIPRVEEMLELLKAPTAATPAPAVPPAIIGTPGPVQNGTPPPATP